MVSWRFPEVSGCFPEVSGGLPNEKLKKEGPWDQTHFRPGLMKSNHLELRKTVPVRIRDYSRLRTAKLPRHSQKIESFGTVDKKVCFAFWVCSAHFAHCALVQVFFLQGN